MSLSDDNLFSESGPREGAFDAQLSFSVPYAEAPAPISSILKRDGSEAPFEQHKIGDAIFKAAQAIGGEDRDRANSLASGVTIYLAKLLNGAVPTVDQVHDAVERVLLEMGHARTARAYMRYRVRRSHQRALRAGDVEAILTELDDAHRQNETLQSTIVRPLFVRNSDERLGSWDRDRIVEALVREARMPREAAQSVARDVEQQIARAGMTTLTAALVRELVDARLVELGLEAYRGRHMRLGVPLYDTERIICTPNQGEQEGIQDPASTDIALARRVKREFALSTVHSAEATDAHLRGDMHIHDLAHIDRLRNAAHSLAFLKRFGLAMYAGSRFAPPPNSPESLLLLANRFSPALQRHFVEPVRWSAFNHAIGSMIPEPARAECNRIARLSLIALTAPSETHPPEVELEWPAADGASRKFAQSFAQAWGNAMDSISDFGEPTVAVPVTADALQDSAFRDWLGRLLSTHARRMRMVLRFVRGLEHAPETDTWSARDVVGGAVTINLPRAAATATSESDAGDAIARILQVAVTALAERKRFIEHLFAFGGVGPMAVLAFRDSSTPYLDQNMIRYEVRVTGLNECAQLITGEELRNSKATVEVAQRLLQRARHEAQIAGANEQVRVTLGADHDGRRARRFAALDLQANTPNLHAFVKSDVVTRDATYTPGVTCGGTLTPMEQLRIEGALNGELSSPAVSNVSLGDAEPSPESLVNLIEKVYLQTNCASLRFC